MYKPLIIISLLLLCVGISSCYDENSTYGDKWVSSVFRNVYTDTTSVWVTAVKIDSLETSGTDILLVGQYEHAVWGTVSSHAFIPYSPPSYNTDIGAVVVLDSFVLRLTYDSHFWGDTMIPQKVDVYQLTERIRLNDNGYLYSDHSVEYNPEIIGSQTFYPRPNSGEAIEVRLPDELGQDFLTRLHLRDEMVASEYFEDFFQGLMIASDLSASQSILGFSAGDSLSALVLHYSVIAETDVAHQIWFMPKTERAFNHIDHDPSGTIIDGLPSTNVEVISTELNNKGVLFGGLGWYSRLDFPFLNNYNTLGEEISIEQAVLMIYPEMGTYSDFNLLPDSIYLYVVNENNVVTDAVMDYLGSEVQASTLVKNEMYPDENYYYFDVTSFMQSELGAVGVNKHSLQLVFSSTDYTRTFKNMTFHDQNSNHPIILELIYKIYESY